MRRRPQKCIGVSSMILTCMVAASVTATPARAGAARASVTVTTSSRAFLPGIKGVRLFDKMPEDQQISEEMAVRILYRTLQETTAASGKPVTFVLSDFSTLYPTDFSRVHWSELVTPPGGRHVKIERFEIRASRAPVGISYEPSWTTDPSDQSSELQTLIHRRSVSQLFAELAPQDKNLGSVLAVTRYQVTVSFEGISRIYNAAVLWLDPDRDGVATLAVQDNVTDRVDEAVTERLNAAPRATLEQQALEGTASGSEGDSSLFLEKATSCAVRSWSYSFPLSLGPNSQGHSSGYHKSSAKFNYRCDCNSTCRSTCTPSLTLTSCYETGNLSGAPGTHKTRTSSSIQAGSKPNTDFVGADCGSGWACFIQFCPANICSGFTISTSAQPIDVGVEVVFNASSQPVWDGQLNFPFQCDGCAAGEPGDAEGPTGPPPIENIDPNPGGGTGGGGAGGSCYWSCTTEWLPGAGANGLGEYREECTIIC